MEYILEKFPSIRRSRDMLQHIIIDALTIAHLSDFIDPMWDKHNWKYWTVSMQDVQITDNDDYKCLLWFIDKFRHVDIRKAKLDISIYNELVKHPIHHSGYIIMTDPITGNRVDKHLT